MLSVCDQEYLDEVKKWAAENSLLDSLQGQLNILAYFHGDRDYDNGNVLTQGGKDFTICRLGKDFAPRSFSFAVYKLRNDRDWDSIKHIAAYNSKDYGIHDMLRDEVAKYHFNGGLIYHGPDSPGDGSFPALSVSLSSSNKPRWEIHT